MKAIFLFNAYAPEFRLHRVCLRDTAAAVVATAISGMSARTESGPIGAAAVRASEAAVPQKSKSKCMRATE